MINDPVAVGKLQQDIEKTADGLEEQLQKTEIAMDTVAESWRDMQFHKYHEEFSKDKDQIKPLINILNEYKDGPLQQLITILIGYGEL